MSVDYHLFKERGGMVETADTTVPFQERERDDGRGY